MSLIRTPRMNRFCFSLGSFVASGSALLLAVTVGNLVTLRDHTVPGGVLLGLLAFFLASGASGIALARSATRKRRLFDRRDVEHRILRAVASRRGKVTPEEVALDCRMTIANATKEIESMYEHGVCALEVTDSGRIVYVFDGFLSESEKGTSKELLQ